MFFGCADLESGTNSERRPEFRHLHVNWWIDFYPFKILSKQFDLSIVKGPGILARWKVLLLIRMWWWWIFGTNQLYYQFVLWSVLRIRKLMATKTVPCWFWFFLVFMIKRFAKCFFRAYRWFKWWRVKIFKFKNQSLIKGLKIFKAKVLT